jgi:hypothetical protein
MYAGYYSVSNCSIHQRAYRWRLTGMPMLTLSQHTVSDLLGSLFIVDSEQTMALDLTEASLLESDPAAERARLRSRGFVRGDIVTFSADAHRAPGRSMSITRSVSITRYQLADTQQAAYALRDVLDALRAAAVDVGFVGDIEGGVLRDEDGQIAVLTFTVANHHVVVVAHGCSVDEVGRIAAAQRELIVDCMRCE